MKPYYQDESVTLYHGDCREVTDWLEADVLVTDPPYGVELGNDADMRGKGHGLAKTTYASYEDTHENLVTIVAPVISEALGAVKRGAVFSGPHLQDFPKASAVGGIYCPAASGRHSWGFKTFLPVLFYGKDPLLNKGARPNVIQSSVAAEKNGHPCPKPLEWMRWLVDRVTLPGEVVCDPFAGSGTTLVAAKGLGLRAIGVELDERYCEIAAKRLAQGVLDFGDAS
jgi:DNA modification methylase